ncbi:hypothetical protein SPRG_09714 [Saprolegnia parasitica CBS 223.65]|uniref:Secreted protein n=1 Tax=Saprolegnia parasitica (strain CBS 223.65) TaxID=695850 RepID=A0A067C2G6_SAPPC|nr:hypothetical protein SPRG_09714 [Saprolegnia parasitica CBS 223.65]KDO24984.1 hypothetical protein SPRG_09714 [Saprolegnia parasitica CBS 223.65]|eukprot:XP_012204253.1 hypothetical protein SPRG_09714 [Saprolegnia parasitica CBS 223.65]
MKAVLLRLAVCATMVLAAFATAHPGCGADVSTTAPVPTATTAAPAPTTEAPGTWRPLGLGNGFKGVSGDSQGLCFFKKGEVFTWVPGQPTMTSVGSSQEFASCANGTKETSTLVTGPLGYLSPTDGQTLCIRDPGFRCATNDGNGFGSFQDWTHGRLLAVRAFVKDHALIYDGYDGYVMYYATVDATKKAITNFTKIADGFYAAADGSTVCVTSLSSVISCVTSVTDMLAGRWKTYPYDNKMIDAFEVVGNTVYGINFDDGTLHYLQLA